MKAWETGQIGDLCITGSGGTPLRSRSEYYVGGTIPWLLSGEVAQGEIFEAKNFITEAGLANSAARVFPENSVLIAMYGATAGQVGILRFKAATNQAVCAILPSKKLVPEFLFYTMLSKKAELISQATGNAQPNISQIKIKNTEIPLPSLPEQRRIVAILDEAFAGLEAMRANAEKNLQNADKLFQSLVESRVFQISNKSEWKSLRVEDVAAKERGSIRTGPFGSQLLHGEFVDDGIAVLGIDNAVENDFRWGKRRYITEEKYKNLARYRVKPGDVLITIMGTCGRCAVVPDDIPLAINTKHLCCISLDQRLCLPRYLHTYFLHHPIAKEFLNRMAKGSIMAGLNMGIIKDLPLQLPSIATQRAIVETFSIVSDDVDGMKGVYRQKLAAIAELKQSILQKAFSGQLTSAEMIPA